MWHIWSEMLSEKGDIALAKGDSETAISYYNRALTINPDNADTYLHLARFYSKQEQYEKAIDCFQHALSAEQDSSEILLELGNTYLHANDIDRASECFVKVIKRCLTKVPLLPEALEGMSIAFFKQGNLLDADCCRKSADRLRFKPKLN